MTGKERKKQSEISKNVGVDEEFILFYLATEAVNELSGMFYLID